jgi:hypothetical protein
VSETDLFRALGVATFRMGTERELVYSEDVKRAHLLPGIEVDLLHACHEFRTLDDHAREIGRIGGLPPAEIQVIRERLLRFAEAGLLVSRRDLLDRCRRMKPGRPEPQPPATLGIVTKDRPESLERCLASYVENAKTHGRPCRFIVLDDSPDPEMRRRTREKLGPGIRYGGPPEKRRFADAMVREGADPETVEFALFDPENCGRTTGANRNALLLETIGELFVSVDDDTVCRIGSVPGGEMDRLALSSEIEMADTWFHPDRDSALKASPVVSRDFMALHGEYLGRELGGLVGGPASRGAIDLDTMDSRFLQRLTSGEAEVRVTQIGLAGDCAMGTSAWLHGRSGPSRDRFLASEAAYRSACASREVVRAARVPTLSDRPYLMTYGTGFDHRRLLPPFMPVHRFQDGLFALTLRKCFDGALIGHLPWTILHAPPDRRAFSPDDVWKQPFVLHFGELTGMLMGSFEPGPARPSGADRLRMLGRHLMDLGALPLSHFEEILRKLHWLRTGQRAGQIESDLRQFEGTAPFWAADLRKTLDELHRRLTDDDFVLPFELLKGRDRDAARDLARRLVARFGRLLHDWPDLVEVARAVRAKGVTLSEVVTEIAPR